METTLSQTMHIKNWSLILESFHQDGLVDQKYLDLLSMLSDYIQNKVKLKVEVRGKLDPRGVPYKFFPMINYTTCLREVRPYKKKKLSIVGTNDFVLIISLEALDTVKPGHLTFDKPQSKMRIDFYAQH